MAKYERNQAEPGYSYAGLQFAQQNAAKLCSGSFLAALCGLGPECFKTVFRELPGSTLRGGPRMLQNCALGASWLHFASWLQNSSKLCSGSFLAPLCGLGTECSKTVFWELPGSTLRVGSRMLQNCALGTSCLDFAGRLQNSSKLCSGSFLGALWAPGVPGSLLTTENIINK